MEIGRPQLSNFCIVLRLGPSSDEPRLSDPGKSISCYGNTILAIFGWTSFADLRATFNSADQVGGKVVFNIGGNNYRLVGLVAYRTQRAFVIWIGTHAEYDRINVANL